MDQFSRMKIFSSQPIGEFCSHYSASPGYDSDPNPDPDDSIVKACADLEKKINYGDIPEALDGKYGHYINECANQTRQNGQVQAFCNVFLEKHECDFRRGGRFNSPPIILDPISGDLLRSSKVCCYENDEHIFYFHKRSISMVFLTLSHHPLKKEALIIVNHHSEPPLLFGSYGDFEVAAGNGDGEAPYGVRQGARVAADAVFYANASGALAIGSASGNEAREICRCRYWKLHGINVPLNPDELQLKKAVDTAAKWCLAFDFSDKMLSHMKEVLENVCSSDNRELVLDCFRKAAGKIMKCLLNYLAATIKTDGAFLYFQENPSLFICILAMYELILEASWISSEDRKNFLRQLDDKMQPMLASDELLNLHNMKEACEENGGIHNNTSNFMFFIAKVIKYYKAVAIIGLPNEYKTLASVGDVRIDLLQGVIPKVLSQIFSASKTLKPDLLLIVKMNNTQFISGALVRMGLGLCLQICAYNDENVRNWIDDFVKLAWSRVGYHLNSSTGFFPICWKSPSPDIKGYIRAFHQTCLCQQDYVILDNKLRERVHNAIINEIISPYEEVLQFANDRERNEESNSPESLKRKVKELYERRLMNFDRLFR